MKPVKYDPAGCEYNSQLMHRLLESVRHAFTYWENTVRVDDELIVAKAVNEIAAGMCGLHEKNLKMQDLQDRVIKPMDASRRAMSDKANKTLEALGEAVLTLPPLDEDGFNPVIRDAMSVNNTLHLWIDELEKPAGSRGLPYLADYVKAVLDGYVEVYVDKTVERMTPVVLSESTTHNADESRDRLTAKVTQRVDEMKSQLDNALHASDYASMVRLAETAKAMNFNLTQMK